MLMMMMMMMMMKMMMMMMMKMVMMMMMMKLMMMMMMMINTFMRIKGRITNLMSKYLLPTSTIRFITGAVKRIWML